MLVHTLDQPEVAKGQGPVALVLAPTRELAEQIHKEARRFAKAYDLRVAAAFGGLSKFDQVKELKAGSEVRRRGGCYARALRPGVRTERSGRAWWQGGRNGRAAPSSHRPTLTAKRPRRTRPALARPPWPRLGACST